MIRALFFVAYPIISSMDRRKEVSSEMIWSAGVTTTMASGFLFRMERVEYAIHGAVWRLYGSKRMLLSGTSGSCFLTRLPNLSRVTTKIFSFGTILENLSYVSLKKDFPFPAISRNCFGRDSRLIGQK